MRERYLSRDSFWLTEISEFKQKGFFLKKTTGLAILSSSPQTNDLTFDSGLPLYLATEFKASYISIASANRFYLSSCMANYELSQLKMK